MPTVKISRAAGVVVPIDTIPANVEVEVSPVTSSSVVVAKLRFAKSAFKFVDEAVVAKNDVVVAPVRVSMLKTEVEAAFKTLNARPLTGVWRVVVAP